MKKKLPVPRNGHAHAEIMRKGGRHEKTHKALRRKENMKNRISRQEDAVFFFL